MGFSISIGGITFGGVNSENNNEGANKYTNWKINNFKSELESFFNNGQFDPENGIAYEDYRDLNFIKLEDNYRSTDKISGLTRSGIPFECSHIYTWGWHQDSDGDESKVVGFNGTGFKYTFQNNFPCIVLCKPKNLFSGTGHNVMFGYKKFVTGNENFNKEFKILTNQPEAVPYILTPKVQEVMLNLAEVYKNTINICFTKNNIFVFKGKTDLLKPPTFGKNKSEKVNEILESTKQFIETVNQHIDNFYN